MIDGNAWFCKVFFAKYGSKKTSGFTPVDFYFSN